MPERRATARRALLSALALVLGGALFAGAGAGPAAAHPLDQLTQHVIVDLDPVTMQVSFALSGGLLANELVLADLDPDGDGRATTAERDAWLAAWARDAHLALDGVPVPVDPADIALTVPALADFHLGLAPIIVTVPVKLPPQTGGAPHRLVVGSDYLLERSGFKLDVRSRPGAALTDQSWPSRSMRLTFTTDPGLAVAPGDTTAAAASAWSTDGVAARAKRLLGRERTTPFVLVLLAIFAGMGALHAMQPGHGKTLVAAYLVATGGTPRDAVALAGIVTATHTVSVFALGGATLAASRLFLPSKVIPVMGAISGLIVAGMGLAMLAGVLRRRAGHGDPAGSGHDAGPVHDHATLGEEEHARAHLAEALALRGGVGRRRLLALGVFGGLTPCPDALAILLLAIGMGQAAMGMLAIVAFSVGLAAVLVVFGLAIALAGPFWARARDRATARPVAGALFSRLMTAAPLVSAAVVLLLGLAMAWRSVALG